MSRAESFSTHFNAVIDDGVYTALSVGKPLESNRGVEGVKYSGVDVRGLDLGFDVGFMTVGDEKTISLRYDNWSQMRQDGLENYLVNHCVAVSLINEKGQLQQAIISEDLSAEGWEIFEANQVYRNIGELGELSKDATRWVRHFLNNLNSGDSIDKIRHTISTLPPEVGKALSWYADFYYQRYGKLPDNMDPVIEDSLNQLVGSMRRAGWTARTGSIFVMTRRSKWGDLWPYERKLIIGDVGLGVFKGGEGGLDKKHLDHFYSFLSYFYSQGK